MQIIATMADKCKANERACFEDGCAQACKKHRDWLEAMDAELMEKRDKETYRCVDKRETTLKTVMGEVSFARRYYKVQDAQGARYVFLLDEAVGLGECGRMSGLLTDVTVSECMNTSFRKAADAVSEMTGQSISHGGAWKALQERGERLGRQEARLAELNDMEALHGERETKVMFEEVDGVWLSMQGNDRPKRGGKREIKVSTQYSGWKETAKGRYETVGKVAYAGFDAPREFYRRRDALTAMWYDTDEIEVRILNGDGASWITSTDEDAIVQLDPFHRSRAIIRGLADKDDRAKVFGLFKAKDVDGALKYINGVLDKCVDEKEAKRIAALHTYLDSNRANLLTWDERGISLPTPPDGLVYRRLGTQEHSNCDLIAQRMKNRKASWSVKGGGHMAKLLCRRATGEPAGVHFDGAGSLSTGNAPAPLAAAKTPTHDGNGYGGGLPRASWPFESVAQSEGRRSIKDIFHLRRV